MEEHAALQVGKTTSRTVGRALHTMPGAEQNIQSLELLLLLLRFEIMLQQGKRIWNHGKQQQKKQDTTQIVIFTIISLIQKRKKICEENFWNLFT